MGSKHMPKIKTKMYILMALFLLPATSWCQEPPNVCLKELDGPCFTGSWTSTTNGIKYASFQGIRYAQPPVGNLRFKSPQPYKYDKKMVDVSTESNIHCPQIDYFSKKEYYDEDCLVINIYIPDIALPDVI